MAYIFCPSTWIVFINIFVVFLSSWLGGDFSNSGKFYIAYRKFYNQDRVFFAPPAWAFGVVWALLYALLIAAVFIFYLHDDTCKCDLNDPASYSGPFAYQPNGMACVTAYTEGKLQMATWALIVINLFFNKTFERLTADWSRSRAMWSMVSVLLTFVTAVAVAVLLYFAAANIHSVLYFSAAVYTVYAIWLAIASVLAVYIYIYYEDVKKEDYAVPLLSRRAQNTSEFARALKSNKRR